MHICIYAYMHMCIYAYMHIRIHEHMHICTYAYIYMYAYMHICIYASMHLCTHTHISNCLWHTPPPRQCCLERHAGWFYRGLPKRLGKTILGRLGSSWGFSGRVLGASWGRLGQFLIDFRGQHGPNLGPKMGPKSHTNLCKN